MSAFLLKYRYFILCFVLFVLMVFQAINGQWGGDFWEHAAVVRELATHPRSPMHPILLLHAPHSFYSPYALSVGLISRVTGLDSATTLSILGIANLFLFLFGLNLFISSLFPENSDAASFYALLFILCLWGTSQYCASGFFNLLSLSYNLPYPSTFAVSVVFTTLAMWIWLLRDGHIRWIVPIAGAASVVLLTHPLTYIFLVVGLVGILVSEQARFGPSLYLIILVFAVSFVVAVVWPYYPFLQMILSDPVYNNSLKADSVCFFQAVPWRVLPALIGVPVIFLRMRANWRDPLGLMFVMFVTIYAGAAMFRQLTYGRVLSPLVITLQLALAAEVARIESKLNFARFSHSFQRGVYCTIIVLVSLACSAWYFPHILERSVPRSPSAHTRFTFLSKFIPQYDVVLSDFTTKLIIPTFGGKLVASDRPLAFVPDLLQRRRDVKDFFSLKSHFEKRLAVVRRYGCRHILFSKEKPGFQKIVRAFLRLGSIVYEDKEFILLSLAPDRVKSTSSTTVSIDSAGSAP